MTMSNSRTARAQINRFSCASSNHPSFYFVHGYFVGLAINPQMIPPSNWLPKLFVRISVENENQFKDIDGVMWQFNQVMQQAMDYSIKLPAQCKLSPTDFEGSLTKGAPLPQWCDGLIAGLKLIDKRTLNKSQKEELKKSLSTFAAFLSYDKLKQRFSAFGGQWQQTASAVRRIFVYEICDLLSALRFVDDDFIDNEDDDPFIVSEQDEQDSELEEMLDFALYNDSVEAHTLLEALIESFELKMGKAYFKENTGHFWLMHETRPYMQLRSRRAGIKFDKGQVKAAADELQALISLNPNDNQGVRFPLTSWLVILEDWPALQQLVALFPEDESLPILAANALMLFALHGDSAEAKKAKKTMHLSNKHTIKYLTGQKTVKQPSEFYQPGQASEAEMYIEQYAKEAWRSVPGALFWLRKN